jgi:hypothetical protein
MVSLQRHTNTASLQSQSLLYTDGYSDSDGHCHRDSNANNNYDTYSHAICNSDSNSHCDSDSNGEAHPYAKVRPNTTASPYSTAATIGFRR